MTYRFVPLYGNTGAVDIGRCFVFKILESRIAGLLSIAGLETKVEETTNAILGSSRGEVHDEAEAFALSGVLLDDGFAGLDLTEARGPMMKIGISSVWHKATNVDIGDAFRVL